MVRGLKLGPKCGIVSLIRIISIRCSPASASTLSQGLSQLLRILCFHFLWLFAPRLKKGSLRGSSYVSDQRRASSYLSLIALVMRVLVQSKRELVLRLKYSLAVVEA